MELLFEIVGEVLLEILQVLWPPILAVVNGGLVLCFAFLTWLFFTEEEPVKAAISLLLMLVFVAVGVVCLKTGVYTRKDRANRRKKR